MSRKIYNEELNKVNTKYNELKVALIKLGALNEHLEQLNSTRRSLVSRLDKMYSDDLKTLNNGNCITIKE